MDIKGRKIETARADIFPIKFLLELLGSSERAVALAFYGGYNMNLGSGHAECLEGRSTHFTVGFEIPGEVKTPVKYWPSKPKRLVGGIVAIDHPRDFFHGVISHP